MTEQCATEPPSLVAHHSPPDLRVLLVRATWIVMQKLVLPKNDPSRPSLASKNAPPSTFFDIGFGV